MLRTHHSFKYMQWPDAVVGVTSQKHLSGMFVIQVIKAK